MNMILVYFRGRGAWIINDNDSVRLAFNYYENEIVGFNERLEPIESNDRKKLNFPVISGVFKLSESDENIFKYTGNLDHVYMLFPCTHKDSHFLKLVDEGKLIIGKAENYYFEIGGFEQTGKLSFKHSSFFIKEIEQNDSECVLVCFSGHGKWFLKTENSLSYGIHTHHKYLYKVEETGEIICDDEFFRLYGDISEIWCNKLSGVFALRKEDAAEYLATNDLSHVQYLLPCKHELSGFDIAVEEGFFAQKDFERCFFWIQSSIDKQHFNGHKINQLPYDINNVLRLLDEQGSNKSNFDLPDEKTHDITPKQKTNKKPIIEERLDLLKQFANYIVTHICNLDKSINVKSLDCTKNDLIDFIKHWEKTHIHKDSWRWDSVDGFNSCKKLWSDPRRKEIIGTLSELNMYSGNPGKAGKKESPLKKYFQ